MCWDYCWGCDQKLQGKKYNCLDVFCEECENTMEELFEPGDLVRDKNDFVEYTVIEACYDDNGNDGYYFLKAEDGTVEVIYGDELERV